MNENHFQAKLIRKIKKLLPSCVVLKNDARYIQGIPDLTILYEDKYFVLECKRDAEAYRLSLISNPNQGYYVNLINNMGGYARHIYPENEKEILDEIVHISRPSGT